MAPIRWSYLPAMVLFPTPPLALETATTFETWGILRFCGGPERRGSVGTGPERRGRPYYRPVVKIRISPKRDLPMGCGEQRWKG